MKQIICKDLKIGYEKKILINSINLTISEGEYWCITGANGMGKTTFIKTLLKLIPSISGEIILSDGLHQTDIGYLPQQKIHQKNFPASVEEIVISGNLNKSKLRWYYNKEEKARAKQNILKLGLKGLEKKSYNTLSGGQQQRVLLARALCATSKIIILDEPVSGLDPNVTQDMYNVIKKLNTEDKITIITISHDVQLATQDATHLLHFEKDGKYTIKLKGGSKC
ncbi:ABC transporter [Candidatus Epulonipiscium fishelsonii]|uniref:ABC transporter n=1 Tax=Candidatus Epulonipiscium fishelsonii TaxID=77094 RepID=A0ACC8XH98_9FIRM|nr:ABC transporter [Epulopiscium sp. SCG-B05WGA-EpuloA1]ONI42893.1 ABC transporter [Epulopiscium sp. SCG-B11WGA-EpuloA1]